MFNPVIRGRINEYAFNEKKSRDVIKLMNGVLVLTQKITERIVVLKFLYHFRKACGQISLSGTEDEYYSNKIYLTAQYQNNKIRNLTLSMIIHCPESLKSIYFPDYDMPDGEKFFIQFFYSKKTVDKKVKFEMEKIELSSDETEETRIIDLAKESGKKFVFTNIKFPHPLLDVVEEKAGKLALPYRYGKTNGDMKYFTFACLGKKKK